MDTRIGWINAGAGALTKQAPGKGVGGFSLGHKDDWDQEAAEQIACESLGIPQPTAMQRLSEAVTEAVQMRRTPHTAHLSLAEAAKLHRELERNLGGPGPKNWTDGDRCAQIDATRLPIAGYIVRVRVEREHTTPLVLTSTEREQESL